MGANGSERTCVGLVVRLVGKGDPTLMRVSVDENTCKGNCTDVIIRVDSCPNILCTSDLCKERRSNSNLRCQPFALSLSHSLLIIRCTFSAEAFIRCSDGAASWIMLCFWGALLFLECAPCLWLFCFLWFRGPLSLHGNSANQGTPS